MSVLENGFHHSQFRWIIFDAVGTVMQPSPPVATAYYDVARRSGSKLDRDEIGQRFRQAFNHSEHNLFPGGPTTGSPLISSDAIELARWRWIVTEVIPDLPNPDQGFTELWDHFARPDSWSCFDDVPRVLDQLRRDGIQLAIASNFDSRLHSVLNGHPELNAIETRFVSSEVGYRKPAPEFYRAMIERCDCPAEQILMIGDDPSHDVEGPISLGINALLIDRKSTTKSGQFIRSLDELLLSVHK